jgi:RNA polymerase sigma factor (sigma-70 family)
MRTDEDLLLDVRRGDTSAFDDLYQRYSRRLYGYIFQMIRSRDLAEDLLQDVFMAVLSDRTYEPRIGQFGGWLFTVARNRCLTHRRSAERQTERLRELVSIDESSCAPSPEGQAEHTQELETLYAALSSLPALHQDVLLLKQLGELTYKQIAEIQAVPEGTAKSRLHHAIKALRGLLGEKIGSTMEVDHGL